MAAHYGLSQALSAPTMDRLVDLSPVTTGAFAFPAYGEGLKDIAASLGFAWRQKEVSALTSITLYHDYVGSGGSNRAARQKVLDYNEGDCRATAHIYDWLLSQ
jgi:predicted RecB family nuclease